MFLMLELTHSIRECYFKENNCCEKLTTKEKLFRNILAASIERKLHSNFVFVLYASFTLSYCVLWKD